MIVHVLQYTVFLIAANYQNIIEYGYKLRWYTFVLD